MFGHLHGFLRHAIIKEISDMFTEHPYYSNSTTKDSKFQMSPVFVSEIYNFDGRQFPAILIETSASKEVRLDMSNFMEDVRGHVRITEILPWIVQKVEDDGAYAGEYSDNTYSLDFANINRENKREIQMRIIDGTTETATYHAVSPFTTRTDIITGARIVLGSFNDIEIGRKIYVETFKDETVLGERYAKGFDFDVTVKVVAQSVMECKELLDMVNSFFVYLLPQRFFNGYGVVLKECNIADACKKDGEIGEETFSGSFTISAFTEHQFFRPTSTFTSYQVWLELREKIESLAETL